MQAQPSSGFARHVRGTLKHMHNVFNNKHSAHNEQGTHSPAPAASATPAIGVERKLSRICLLHCTLRRKTIVFLPLQGDAVSSVVRVCISSEHVWPHWNVWQSMGANDSANDSLVSQPRVTSGSSLVNWGHCWITSELAYQ